MNLLFTHWYSKPELVAMLRNAGGYKNVVRLLLEHTNLETWQQELVSDPKLDAGHYFWRPPGFGYDAIQFFEKDGWVFDDYVVNYFYDGLSSSLEVAEKQLKNGNPELLLFVLEFLQQYEHEELDDEKATKYHHWATPSDSKFAPRPTTNWILRQHFKFALCDVMSQMAPLPALSLAEYFERLKS